MRATSKVHGRRSVSGARRGRGARAFTLVELLVVISVIALIVAMLLPSMDQVFEIVYTTICQNHLKELSKTMQGGASDSILTIPEGSLWTDAAVQYGSKELMVCPKDDVKQMTATSESLGDYYILQWHGHSAWYITNLAASFGVGEGLLQDGQLIRDDQIPRVRPQHSGSRPCWCKIPNNRADNEKLVSITDEGTILVKFETGRITITSIHGCGSDRCWSRHWLMKGDSTNASTALQEDETIMRMGGDDMRTSAQPNPPLKQVINTGRETSYGINGLIRTRQFGQQQLMFMDAKDVVIDFDEEEWFERIDARHFVRERRGVKTGKVNFVTVGGSVRTITKTELMDEYNLYDQEKEKSTSLWNYLACPRD